MRPTIEVPLDEILSAGEEGGDEAEVEWRWRETMDVCKLGPMLEAVSEGRRAVLEEKNVVVQGRAGDCLTLGKEQKGPSPLLATYRQPPQTHQPCLAWKPPAYVSSSAFSAYQSEY